MLPRSCAIEHPGAPATIAAVMAAGILGGWVLYRLVETPFMRARERWYPGRPSRLGYAELAGPAGSAAWPHAAHKP